MPVIRKEHFGFTDVNWEWAEIIFILGRNLTIVYVDLFVEYLALIYFHGILGYPINSHWIKDWRSKYELTITNDAPWIKFKLRSDASNSMKYKKNYYDPEKQATTARMDDTPAILLEGDRSLDGKNMGFVGYLYELYSLLICMILFIVIVIVFNYMYGILGFLYS